MAFRQTPLRPVIGASSAMVGIAILIVGSYYMMFKNPRSNVEDLFGLVMWILGSGLLGGGLALTFTRGRPWIALVVAFLSPGFTCGLVVAFTWAYVILNAILAARS